MHQLVAYFPVDWLAVNEAEVENKDGRVERTLMEPSACRLVHVRERKLSLVLFFEPGLAQPQYTTEAEAEADVWGEGEERGSVHTELIDG